jgi:hypothetical protein
MRQHHDLKGSEFNGGWKASKPECTAVSLSVHVMLLFLLVLLHRLDVLSGV